MCPRGHNGLRWAVSGACYECGAIAQKLAYDNGYRADTTGRIAVNKKWNASSAAYASKMRWKEKDPKWAWVVSATGGARTRARKHSLPFNLTNAYIKSILPEVCPALGLTFDFGPKGSGPRWNSPAIDRIIPEFGYIVGNVAVISHRANVIKHDATAHEVMLVAKWLQTL
jgi:hypothetical protein